MPVPTLLIQVKLELRKTNMLEKFRQQGWMC